MTKTNKTGKYRLLLWIIPFILILLAVWGAEHLFSGPEQETKQKTWEAETITLDLVTGKAGSLTNDVGTGIYAKPSQGSKRLGELQYNCCVFRSDAKDGENDAWIRVSLPDQDGYVQADQVETDQLVIQAPSKMQEAIIKDAISYVGLRFVKNGDSLEDGIDCSHFIQKLYKKQDITLAGTPPKIRDAGEPVAKDDARAGDIVYYDVNHGGGHVAIYLGSGYQIASMGHAGKTYPQGGVRIGKLKYRDREAYEFYRIHKN